MHRPRIMFPIALFVMSLVPATSFAQKAAGSVDEQGALTPQVINDLRKSFRMDARTRVLHNAVTNNDLKDLVLNRQVLRDHDTHFSHRIDMKGVTNQKASGRCWIFAGFNTMRPKVIREKKLPEFEFSTAYLQFWDKMEKANLYLEDMIAMRDADYLDREWELTHEWALGDGGWWNYVVALIDKYGVVPKDVMPETRSSENTRYMNRVLERKLRVDAAAMHKMHRAGKSVDDLRAYKRKAMRQVYRFLAINLGEPPAEFEWRYEIKNDKAGSGSDQTVSVEGVGKVATNGGGKGTTLSPIRKYTPKSFYKEFVGVPLGDFVCLYNDPTNPYHKRYQFRGAKNMAAADDMDFVNLPINDLKQVAMKSVMANEPLWFACDMGKDQSSQHGIMADRLYDFGPLFDANLKMSKADRIRYRSGGSNHAMVFMGVDVRDGKPVKWLVENSWGADKGDQGMWTLYDKWFDEHVYCIIVHKRFVPDKVLKKFDEKAVVLPPWYPGAMGVR